MDGDNFKDCSTIFNDNSFGACFYSGFYASSSFYCTAHQLMAEVLQTGTGLKEKCFHDSIFQVIKLKIGYGALATNINFYYT